MGRIIHQTGKREGKNGTDEAEDKRQQGERQERSEQTNAPKKVSTMSERERERDEDGKSE